MTYEEENQIILITNMRNNNINELKKLSETYKEFHEMQGGNLWFSHITDEVENETLIFIIKNFKLNPNIKNREGITLLMKLHNERYFNVIEQIMKRYIIDYFIKNSNNIDIIDYCKMNKSKLFKLYNSLSKITERRTILMNCITNKDYENINEFLKNNVNYIGVIPSNFDKYLIIQFLRQDCIRYDLIFDIEVLLEHAFEEDIHPSLEFKRVEIFFAKYRTIIDARCRQLSNFLKIKKLIYNKKNLLKDYESNNSIIHNVCSYGFVNVLEVLIINEADVNIKDCYSRTPLHLCADGSPDIVKTLLKHPKIDLCVKNNQGKTASFYANELTKHCFESKTSESPSKKRIRLE